MAVASASDLPAVVDIRSRLQSLLERASNIKSETTLEPPLPIVPFLDIVDTLYDVFTDIHDDQHRFYCVETAAGAIFHPLIRDLNIHDPAFVNVWNFLDILIICSDQRKGNLALVCLLIEELLESQTTRDCRIVFDYLESRRERLVQHGFHGKSLALLRSCNELLRRLSRAEDANFCGRVFFFLFQTFPLGDKSSVNLRGEFHVENVTKFELLEPVQSRDGMQVDAEPAKAEEQTSKAATPQPAGKPGSKAIPIKPPAKKADDPVLTNKELYPIFWRLQQEFSDPTRLFTASHFETFKQSLASTIIKFRKTPTVVQTKSADDKDAQRGTKRKFGEDGSARNESKDVTNGLSVNPDQKDHFLDNYNPKYLTSRDLFDLELSDQAFQRHILVQALILIDFLLSLTEKAKKTLATPGSTTNKALRFSFTLSEEDTNWAISTRKTITNYFTEDQEGRLFNRMVDTVLARDKNWIHWKIESCPSIVRDPVSTESELASRRGAREWTKTRRVPAKPAGSMDLSFLDEGSGGGLAALQNPDRYTTATIDELIDGIIADELDLDFAADDVEKATLENAIANKRWRILRQARATRLEVLDKVDPGKGLESVFRPPREATPVEPEADDAAVVAVVDSEEAGEHAEDAGAMVDPAPADEIAEAAVTLEHAEEMDGTAEDAVAVEHVDEHEETIETVVPVPEPQEVESADAAAAAVGTELEESSIEDTTAAAAAEGEEAPLQDGNGESEGMDSEPTGVATERATPATAEEPMATPAEDNAADVDT